MSLALTKTKTEVIRAQPGPQEAFLSSSADVVVYGGGAGGGKTYSILLDILRYINDPHYTSIVFRRTSPMLTKPGSIWQESKSLWQRPGIDGVPREKNMTFSWPAGGVTEFSHMEHEKDKYDHQGAQYTGIYFDEGTHFTETQVTYLLSRMRSDADSASYMRISCNPDPDHFLRRWIDWWIDDQGFPIKERSGVLRYFVLVNDEMFWADSPGELAKELNDPTVVNDALSFTFIPALVTDNPKMVEKNPKYISFLKGLPRIEREALLDGNWDVKVESGMYFKREWVTIEPKPPIKFKSIFVRYWDRAATAPNEGNKDPDWTVGVKMAEDYEGFFWILDVIRFRKSPGGVKIEILTACGQDGRKTRCCLEQDPGAAGKSEVNALITAISGEGFESRARKPTGDKLNRFLPFSAIAEAGLVKVVRAQWNDPYFKELENFVGDGKGKDDQVDGTSGGYNELTQYSGILGGFEIPGLKQANQFTIR